MIMNTPSSYTTCSKSLRGEGVEALKHIRCASLEASLPASHDSHFICPAATSSASPTAALCTTQYRYQAGAED